MDELPAMSWCEEKLEASLSWLAFEAGGDLTAANTTELHNLYMTQCLIGGSVHDVHRTTISKTYLTASRT